MAFCHIIIEVDIMKKITIKMMIFLSMCLIGLGLLNYPKLKAEGELVTSAKTAILIEVETGQVLYEYKAHERAIPASMTKIMSIKLIFDALDSKRITKDQVVTTSSYASSMGGSQIFLSTGEQMRVDDLLKSAIIASANDATVALAETISGSEEFFVASMNQKAKELGLKNTNFVNATGLPVNNHYSTSYDMAMIARSLLLEYEEEVIPYSSLYEDYIRKDQEDPFWLVNTNKLVKHVEGVDGLKTGWTESAGYCLTCTKSVNGMRLISVVMGCDSVPNRTKDTLALLNYGFANYEKEVLIAKGSVISNEQNIMLAPASYNIIASQNVVYLHKKGENKGTINYQVKIDHNAISKLAKYEIGKLQIYRNDVLFQEINLELEVPVVKQSFIKLFIEILKKIF